MSDKRIYIVAAVAVPLGVVIALGILLLPFALALNERVEFETSGGYQQTIDASDLQQTIDGKTLQPGMIRD